MNFRTKLAAESQHRSGTRRRSLLLATALAFSLSAGGAGATGVPVVDAAHTIQNVFTQLWVEAKAAAQYGWDQTEQARHLAQMVKQYQAQLSGAANFMDVSMTMGSDFKERSAEDIARITIARCPGSAGTPDLSELWKAFIPDMSGNIKEQQLKLCQRIVLAESERYNEQVRMLVRVVDSSSELGRLGAQRQAMGSEGTKGEMTANSNDIERLMARSSMDMQYTQTVLTAYDGYIASLQTDQRTLALQAMRGERKPWGSVVQGAVLKTALKIQE